MPCVIVDRNQNQNTRTGERAYYVFFFFTPSFVLLLISAGMCVHCIFRARTTLLAFSSVTGGTKLGLVWRASRVAVGNRNVHIWSRTTEMRPTFKCASAASTLRICICSMSLCYFDPEIVTVLNICICRNRLRNYGVVSCVHLHAAHVQNTQIKRFSSSRRWERG